MNLEEETLCALSGCTAVGKTALALNWAEANDAEIVSCDSLLCYRGLDIGTAKPNQEELGRVQHHLIDIWNANEAMDIGDYVKLAIAAVEDIRSRGKRVLVTGGSGFYLKAFFGPVVDAVEVSPAVREQVSEIEAGAGLGGMVQKLEELDPNCRNEVDTENGRRVIRALERCLETGKSIGQLKAEFAAQSNLLTAAPKRLVVLNRDRDRLNERIAMRVSEMLKNGLIDEVQRLKADGFESNASASGSIGYRETLAYLRGDYDLTELETTIATNTRRLAKKQRTWFRTQLPQGKAIDLDQSDPNLVDTLFI
ncbi:MAG: tRNA (adenosine(37)-N6)-dimethylallyltransferase MiaA [Opitutales bacterium]|nr:tRNA (adenosine(37)-N6)-dimethylallyltransferase MiaA [Opitutales bacterium]